MAQMYEKEKYLEGALTLLYVVVVYNISGADNDLPRILWNIKENKPLIPPAIVADVGRISKRLGMTEEQLFDNFMSRMNRTPIPLVVFSLQECAEILIAEVNKDTEK